MENDSDLDEEEWEYEYNLVETETFLVDVDLTSVNRPVMSANATKAKRGLKIIDQSKKLKLSKKGKKPKGPINRGNRAGDGEDGQNDDQDEETPNLEQVAEEGEDQNLLLLDFHTGNPIISYQGNLFSCTWVDMVGTNMFFSEHQTNPCHRPAVSTPEYDIIGTTRIKLAGNQATVTPVNVEVTDKTKINDTATKSPPRPGAGLGDLKTTNPKINTDTRKQAKFLEQLMEVKKARGELDIVRTVANYKISSVGNQTGPQSPSKRRQLDQLNRRAVKGDGQAFKKLRRIYSELDNTNSEEEEVPEAASIPMDRPRRSSRHQRVVSSGSVSQDEAASPKESQTPVFDDRSPNTPGQEPNQSTDGDEFG